GLCTRPRGRGTLALAGQAWRATPALSSSASGTASGGVAARAAPAARARASVSGRASTRRVGLLLTLPPAGGKPIRPCGPLLACIESPHREQALSGDRRGRLHWVQPGRLARRARGTGARDGRYFDRLGRVALAQVLSI